jgi:tetratricopeptide (TPR) repeat protein
MRSGNAGEAELEFKQLAVGYPQLVGAQINLAILQRKGNHLDEAETTLKSAVANNPSSASAWNELGLTQRMRGEFPDAAASYEKALAADPNFAAAHRNYAVLLDLYMGDPEHALTELERYKELTGEEKPVNGWIAELRQRTGKPPAPRPGAAPAAAPAGQPGAAPTEAAPAESDASGAPPAQPATPPAKPAETPQPRSGATTARAEFGTHELASRSMLTGIGA